MTKDRQAIVVMFSTISKEILIQLNVEYAKQMWKMLKRMNGGTSHLQKSKIQSLRREFETLYMEDDDLVMDFVKKLSQIVA